jgi:hypothetical protein
MDEKWGKIAALDLNLVRRKFELKKGWWWRWRGDARITEREYRQFLYLIVSNPGQTVVPWSRDLDDFWHEHILDTARYARDCHAILGEMIHHNPHLPKGSQPHATAFAATRQMYKAAFGEAARKGNNRAADDIGCTAQMPVVFCEGGAAAGHHHGGHHHDAGGHHGSHDAGAGHSTGHGCGGHGGGHGCGGHGGH